MMNLLSGFAALSLLSGALLALLGEGAVRRAATMVVGLLMLLYWSGGVEALLNSSAGVDANAPATVLSATGIDLPAMEIALGAEDAP